MAFPCWAGPTFTETDFGDYQKTRVEGPADGQITSRVATGGNPDAYWSVTTNTNAFTRTFSFNPAHVHDPSNGAIQSLVFEIDLREFNGFGDGQGYALGVAQDGAFFQAAPDTTDEVRFANQWQAASVSGDTLFQTSFSSALGGTSGTLDFTNGGPITFGIMTRNSGGEDIEVGYDNFSVDLTLVPEPASIAMLIGMLPMLAGRMKRPGLETGFPIPRKHKGE